jgi:hypothetical protein
MKNVLIAAFVAASVVSANAQRSAGARAEPASIADSR